MNINNEILLDYSEHCHRILTTEFGAHDANKYDPIYLYERYKCRIINMRSREIHEASDLLIVQKHQKAYSAILTDISSGYDLKKYQSRKLKNLDYDDDMLSHWSIQHFHLGHTIENDGFVTRTEELLFVHFTQDVAHVLGVFSHNSWCDLNIIEIMHSNWPQELAVFKSESDAKTLTEEEQKTLRKKHANANIRVKDGTEYLSPGIGVTANGAPIFAIINRQKVIYDLNKTFKSIQENILLILKSDPEKRKSETITIGMEINHDKNFIGYKIKETGFKFTLQS